MLRANKDEKMVVNKKEGRFSKISSFISMIVLLFCVVGTFFLVYLTNGGYQIFGENGFPMIEVYFVYLFLFVLIFLSMSILSFAKVLQNVFASLVFGGLVYGFLHQYSTVMPEALLSIFMTQNEIFDMYSDVVIASVFALLLFFILVFCQKKTKNYFSAILMVLFLTFCGYLYITQPKAEQFVTVYEEKTPDTNNVEAKKFVYISFDGLPSYNLLKDWDAPASELMLGFYARNHFNLYPNAYVNKKTTTENLSQFLNFEKQNPDDALIKEAEVAKVFDFNKLNDESVLLKENTLYNLFKLGGYEINAYKNNGIDLCKINDKYAVNKCVDMHTINIDLQRRNLSAFDKSLILVAEWVKSMGVDLSKIPFVGEYTFNNVFAINSLDQLEVAFKDIANNDKQSAYFIDVKMPYSIYAYDQYCKIKPMKNWKDVNDDKTLYKIKQQMLVEQTKCLLGKVQELIDTVQAQNVVYVIASEEPMIALSEKLNKSFINQFKTDRLVSFAISDPVSMEFDVDYAVCQKHNLMSKYLLKKDKCNIKDAMIDEVAINEAKVELMMPFDGKAEDAKNKFYEWYQQFRLRNDIE